MKRTQVAGLQKLFFFVLAIALTVTACKKGDTGPQGEKGDKGDPGATGNNGPKGDKGDPGTANVFYSPWLDLTFTHDVTDDYYYHLINEAKITDEVLSSGEIKVYLNFGSPEEKLVIPLPYFGFANIQTFYGESTIEIDANADVSSFTDTQNKKRFQYRYIIIPGGTALRSSTNINWNNYEEVKKHLGLKD